MRHVATKDEKTFIAELAERHSLPPEAIAALLEALRRSGGTLAQFNHPALGGMGQWSGGMTMIGDMFNDQLKGRVAAAASEISEHVRSSPQAEDDPPASYRASTRSSRGWWPDELGQPGSAGSQNGLRYAIFPSRQRLAIEDGGQVTVYDTGAHVISGVGQSQQTSASLVLTSQNGTVRVADLRKVEDPS